MGEWVSVARYNELSSLWEAEDFSNPETFLYRNSLSVAERRIVERWDQNFVKNEEP